MPGSRRDQATIDYVTAGQALNSDERNRFGAGQALIAPNTTTATRTDRFKGEILKTRMAKQSKSPESYQLGNNLVVQLADPAKK